MKISSLAVFCGSKSGTNKSYQQHANALGRILAEKGITMIYGGGKNGLMGSVANSSLQYGGTVRGVIPKALMNRESQHNDISELMIVEDMHERKRTMYEWCDAALILPGGFGTLDEMFELLTWNQLALHDKKIFILNSEGFYDHLLKHLQVLTAEGFLYGSLEEQITVLHQPEDFLTYLS